MIPLFVVIVAVSVGFVIGAAWGSLVTRTRLYDRPDIAEAIERDRRRSS